MAWVYLFVAGLFEVGWAIGLKYTEGFTRLLPSLWTIASMILSIVLLGLALKTLPVHQIALVVNGVHLLENLKLDELAAKGVSEFAFIMQPLKIEGGTGSTVAPIAVR